MLKWVVRKSVLPLIVKTHSQGVRKEGIPLSPRKLGPPLLHELFCGSHNALLPVNIRSHGISKQCNQQSRQTSGFKINVHVFKKK